MLIKTILILMFLLFAWWFARFAHRDGYQGRAMSRTREQLATDMDNRADVLPDDDPPPTVSGLSFRPDGNLITDVSAGSAEGSLSHTAQRMRAPENPSGDSEEFKSIAASSGITGDDQQQFVASLLRQIDENNRDITLLSASAKENDELIARVTRQETQIAKLNEQLAAQDFEGTALHSSQENSDETQFSSQESRANRQLQESERLKTVEEELAASHASLATLRSQLTQAQDNAAKTNENDLELRRLRSELESVQRERDQTASRLATLHPLAPDSSVSGELRTGASLVQLEAGIKQRDQRIAALEARLPGSSKRAEPAELEQLYTPPAGQDDLKKIKGIGPKMEVLLNQLGVRTFEQLANFQRTDINQVSAALNSFPGRIERDDWVGQSAELVRKQQDGITSEQ